LHPNSVRLWRRRWAEGDFTLEDEPGRGRKAGVILDLYAGRWQGQALGPKDHILSADEKTSIQARIRCHPQPGPRAAPIGAGRARV
jgi:hypothetical protein